MLRNSLFAMRVGTPALPGLGPVREERKGKLLGQTEAWFRRLPRREKFGRGKENAFVSKITKGGTVPGRQFSFFGFLPFSHFQKGALRKAKFRKSLKINGLAFRLFGLENFGFPKCHILTGKFRQGLWIKAWRIFQRNEFIIIERKTICIYLNKGSDKFRHSENANQEGIL